MEINNLLLSEQQQVLTITINRPEKLNALNAQTIQELHHVLSEANRRPDIRVIILTGAGEKAFVAGADIKEFANFSVEQGRRLSADGHRLLFNLIENHNKPVIAAINGFALGGGFELALACHIRICTHDSRVGFPEVTLGVIPGYGGTQRLCQLAGKGRAFELILTADMIGAEDAYRLGLVNHITDREGLMKLALQMAGKMISRSPEAIKRAIRAINAREPSDSDGYQAEIDQFGLCFGTADFIEGTTAFLEKRKPVFNSGYAEKD